MLEIEVGRSVEGDRQEYGVRKHSFGSWEVL
jgi:hypothetical protein